MGVVVGGGVVPVVGLGGGGGIQFSSLLRLHVQLTLHHEGPLQLYNISRYKKHPALVPFGVGKRQCMGEALARNEVLLFTVGLIQRLTFLPPAGGPRPEPENYHVSITRMPDDFHVKIVQN